MNDCSRKCSVRHKKDVAQIASLTLALEQAKADLKDADKRADEIVEDRDNFIRKAEAAERELDEWHKKYLRREADHVEEINDIKRERDEALTHKSVWSAQFEKAVKERDEARRELAEVKAAIPGLVGSVQFGTATRQSGTVAELQTRAESAERRLAEAEKDIAVRDENAKRRLKDYGAVRLALAEAEGREAKLREALEKAHNLYTAANRSLEDTDEDPEAEQGMEMAQVYTLRSSWARLCDAVDEIDVDAPGFKHLLAALSSHDKAKED